MKKIKALLLLLVILISSTCTEVIDLETDEEGGQLVIFGRISNSHIGNYVEVTRTVSYEGVPEAILDAEVKIYDEDGNIERLIMTAPGRYEPLQSILERNVGDSFRLEVNLGGATYTSPYQKINKVLAKDELSWQVAREVELNPAGAEVERDVVQLFASSTFDELPEEFYLRWTIEEVYAHLGSALPSSRFTLYSPATCYVINDLSEQELFLLDGKKVRNTNLNNRFLVSRYIDNSFALKHYFNLIQSAMNPESYEYWNSVNAIVSKQGTIFSVPPAAIPSNIQSSDPDELVLGHFEVIGVDTTRLLITNDDIPIFFGDPCKIDTPDERTAVMSVPPECWSCLVEENILPLECIFCYLAPGFTSERPSYF